MQICTDSQGKLNMGYAFFSKLSKGPKCSVGVQILTLVLRVKAKCQFRFDTVRLFRKKHTLTRRFSLQTR